MARSSALVISLSACGSMTLSAVNMQWPSTCTGRIPEHNIRAPRRARSRSSDDMAKDEEVIVENHRHGPGDDDVARVRSGTRGTGSLSRFFWAFVHIDEQAFGRPLPLPSTRRIGIAPKVAIAQFSAWPQASAAPEIRGEPPLS